jgi:hypothetical protein
LADVRQRLPARRATGGGGGAQRPAGVQRLSRCAGHCLQPSCRSWRACRTPSGRALSPREVAASLAARVALAVLKARAAVEVPAAARQLGALAGRSPAGSPVRAGGGAAGGRAVAGGGRVVGELSFAKVGHNTPQQTLKINVLPKTNANSQNIACRT